jgi:psp operon transcriptional activator
MAAKAPELIGQSRAWLETLEHVSRAALVDRPILVIGERGTGKELIAERLHFLSHRWDKPFVKVNCAALNQELLDSELFGHEAGSFTGATRRRAGRFEQADGGTLFLDEIATASLSVQEKLLRVVEYGEYQRLGGEDVLECDVRVVAATNVDLPSRAADGRFRADLLDRLAFDVVTVAPLRARPDDVELLADHFARRLARELEVDFPGWSRQALDLMREHPWPGNVRELKNAAERAAFRAMVEAAETGGVVGGPVTMRREQLDPFASPWRPRPDLAAPDLAARAASAPPAASPAPPAADTVAPAPASPRPDFQTAVAALEKQLLAEALAAAGGHQGKAAEQLGLSYHQMRGLLRKYGYSGRTGADADAPEPAKA